MTIRDVNSPRAEYLFKERLRDYEKSNAEVYKWVIGEGVIRQDVKVLLRGEPGKTKKRL